MLGYEETLASEKDTKSAVIFEDHPEKGSKTRCSLLGPSQRSTSTDEVVLSMDDLMSSMGGSSLIKSGLFTTQSYKEALLRAK